MILKPQRSTPRSKRNNHVFLLFSFMLVLFLGKLAADAFRVSTTTLVIGPREPNVNPIVSTGESATAPDRRPEQDLHLTFNIGAASNRSPNASRSKEETLNKQNHSAGEIPAEVPPSVLNQTIGTSPRLFVITYATETFNHHAVALIQSMRRLQTCPVETKIYGPADLDEEFVTRNARTFRAPQGAGFWLWKPYVILHKLKEINEGDWLVYIDSRYVFEKDICEMIPYKNSEHDYRCFSRKAGDPKYREVPWTKYDAYKLIDVEPDYNAHQMWAGFIMFRKSPRTVRFVEDWLRYCEDFRIISLDRSVLGPELKGFRQNRNDQTALHLLIRKSNWTCVDLPKHWLYNIRRNSTR